MGENKNVKGSGYVTRKNWAWTKTDAPFYNVICKQNIDWCPECVIFHMMFESIDTHTVARLRRNKIVDLFHYNKEYTFPVYSHLDL